MYTDETPDEPSSLSRAQLGGAAAALCTFVICSSAVGFVVGVPIIGLVLGLVVAALVVLAALMI